MSIRNLTPLFSITTKPVRRTTNTPFSLKLSTTPPMEVEVKLRLPDSNTHQRLSALLSPHHLKTHFQENIFFDTLNSALSSNLTALRIRFYDLDASAVISLKSKPNISRGISTTLEDEENLDPCIARACVAHPSRLLLLDSSRIVKRVKEEFIIGEDSEMVCLGGFRNVRGVYEWNGLRLELDETDFGFGTCYELECESSEPEKAKGLIEGLLNEHGIEFSYSTVSKFAVFHSGKMPQ